MKVRVSILINNVRVFQLLGLSVQKLKGKQTLLIYFLPVGDVAIDLIMIITCIPGTRELTFVPTTTRCYQFRMHKPKFCIILLKARFPGSKYPNSQSPNHSALSVDLPNYDLIQRQSPYQLTWKIILDDQKNQQWQVFLRLKSVVFCLLSNYFSTRADRSTFGIRLVLTRKTILLLLLSLKKKKLKYAHCPVCVFKSSFRDSKKYKRIKLVPTRQYLPSNLNTNNFVRYFLKIIFHMHLWGTERTEHMRRSKRMVPLSG